MSFLEKYGTTEERRLAQRHVDFYTNREEAYMKGMTKKSRDWLLKHLQGHPEYKTMDYWIKRHRREKALKFLDQWRREQQKDRSDDSDVMTRTVDILLE